MEMKMRQYEMGEKFITGVEKEGGWSALDKAWLGPEWLPTLPEIEQPTQWLQRVGLDALSAAVAERLDLPDGEGPTPNGRTPWVVALSGGADSAALAWLTSRRLARSGRFTSIMVWPASDALESAARAVAANLANSDRSRIGDARSLSRENAARTARYHALLAGHR